MSAALLQNANLLLRFPNTLYVSLLACPIQDLFLPGSVLNTRVGFGLLFVCCFFKAGHVQRLRNCFKRDQGDK